MYKRYIKTILDYILALILLPLLLIVTIFVTIAIKLDDGGKVFYIAQRLGKDGKPFGMFKFRSMIENAPDIRNSDNSTYSSPDDPRLTRVGKVLRETSIDELPQILNVLLNQMSFVGPRPDPLDSYNRRTDEQKRRYSVKPGITGYTQAYYRRSLPSLEKLNRELYYVDNVSFWFDLKIIFKTIIKVFKKENVYSNMNDVNIEEQLGNRD